ncbi:MAG TPA: putative Ig domain-containing protein [Anaerolineales bacterium]
MKASPRRVWIALSVSALILGMACMLFLPPRGPLVFSPDALPDAQLGVPYEVKVSLTGNATPAGDFSLSEGALPPGLAMERVEGADQVRISGTPEEAGTFKFKLYVWCYGTNVSGQTGEVEYSLTVK